MIVQQVLTMHTPDCLLRSTAMKVGLADPTVPDGTPMIAPWTSPAEAMAAGWRLLAPPQMIAGEDYAWWLTRDVVRVNAMAKVAGT